MYINWYQCYATFSVTLLIVTCCMHLAWPSPSLPKLLDGSHSLKLTSDEASWLAVINLIGSIFGGIITGFILRRTGCLKALIFCTIPYIGAWLAIAFGNHVAILYVARFIVGFADSVAIIATPMYIGEIADPHIRGFLGSYAAVTMIIGMLLINALGLYLSIKTTALIAISVPVLMAATSVWLPESPYFLLQNGRHEDALKSLKKFKHPNMVDSEYARLKEVIADEMEKKIAFVDIFRVIYYRKAMIINIALRCIQNLVGLFAITFYTDTIFAEVEGAISSKVWVILFYVVKLLTTLFASLIIDRTGRKPLLIISLIGVTLSLVTVGVFSFLEQDGIVDLQEYYYIPITALFVYIITYSIGLGPIAVLMLGELLPARVKSYALCVTDVTFNLTGTITTKFFQATLVSFGLGVPFISFAFCSLVSVGFVIFFVPETKGKTLEQIQEEFKGTKKSVK